MRVCFAVVTILLLLSLSFGFERAAYAYVDPGSSLLVTQSLGAMVAATLYYFRRRLKAGFRWTKRDR